MPQNLKQDRSFRTLDLLSALTLVAMVLSIATVAGSELARDTRPQRASNTAKALALQMRAQSDLRWTETQSGSMGRGPASVRKGSTLTPGPSLRGQLGSDPWGRPYQYALHPVAVTKGGQDLALIVVWSNGPNGKAESEIDRFAARDAQLDVSELRSPLGGDDVGHWELFPISR